MPTGYTSSIYNNKNDSFESFVLSCARAFGACMHQRDDDMCDKPKLRELDIKYHLNGLEESKNNRNPTKDKFESQKKKEIEKALDRLNEIKNLRDRYTSMLDKVLLWTPPTSEHLALKQFMTDQLKGSIMHDCDDVVSYYTADLELWKNMSYDDYVKNSNKEADDAIEYHNREIERETKNVERANKWITELYESLGNKH